MSFDHTRFKLARQRRLLKKKVFADQLGVSAQIVTRWESGKVDPSPQHVEKMAKLLNFPTGFFYEHEVEEPDLETTSFRSQTSMSAAIRDAALAAGSIGFLIADWVDERFDLPGVAVPDLSHYSPEVAARTLREIWGIGEIPISSMVHLLESKGVRVFSLAENTTKVNAYSLWKKGVPYVFLNTFKTAECSRFDAAHELGHLVLHQDGKTTGRAAEDQANQFASSLLMPKADVLAKLPRVHHLGQLIDAKKRWKVSLAALCYRCHKLGIISDWKYRDYCISINSKYGKTEPEGIERERSKVWALVLNALWKDGVGQKKISEDLFIPEQEINDLLFSIVQPDADPDYTSQSSLKLA